MLDQELKDAKAKQVFFVHGDHDTWFDGCKIYLAPIDVPALRHTLACYFR